MFDGMINTIKGFVPKFIALLVAMLVARLIYQLTIGGGFDIGELLHTAGVTGAASVLTLLVVASLDNAK